MLFEVEGYQASERLGAGSQGETFLATDVRTGAKVALKRLRLSSASDWKSVELFEREGEMLSRLDHPGVARGHACFQVARDGEHAFYIAQEYVSGESLDRALARGERLREPQLRAFLGQLAEVLSHLHSRNPPVIHRDLKPSNIMRRAGGADPRYVVIDFGAGQFATPQGPSLEGGSTIVGTSGYMPPEQLLGRTGPQSDLYALGATAIHLLTGVHPSEMRLSRLRLDWREHLRDGFTASEALAALLDRLVAPALEDRIQTAAALVEALAALETPRRGGDGGTDAHPKHRRRALLVAGAFGLLAGAGVLAFVTRPERGPGADPAAGPKQAEQAGARGAPFTDADEYEQRRRRDALPAEDGYPCTVPVSLAVEANLRRSMGEAAADALLADLHLTPRALQSDPSNFRLRLLLSQRGAAPIASLEVLWRVLDADGAPLAAIDAPGVPSFAAPLRAGDIVDVAVSDYPGGKAWPVARVVGEITAFKRAEPEDLGPEAPREVALVWKCPQPEGVALQVRLLSDDSGPPLEFLEDRPRRLRFDLTQTGPAVVLGLKLVQRYVDPESRVSPRTKTVHALTSFGGPSLRPGERRNFSTYEHLDPKLTGLELEVVEVEAVPAPVGPKP